MTSKRFVCRCEDVTYDDVRNAIDSGHDDLESLKRYTGFSTGFCQGKQCVAVCARILYEVTGRAPSLPITPRPPFHPIPLGWAAALPDESDA